MARTVPPGDPALPYKGKTPAHGAKPHGKKSNPDKRQKRHVNSTTTPARSPGAIAAKVFTSLPACEKEKLAIGGEKPKKRKVVGEEDDGEDEIEDNDINESQPSKKAKTNTTTAAVTPVTTDGMSAKDTARFKGNMTIMHGSDKAEYEALFLKMLEVKVLIGKLGNAQAERNKRLEELAKGAKVKANVGKPAWVKKA